MKKKIKKFFAPLLSKVDNMDNIKKTQTIYQKTDFNNNLICQMPSIFKCCKCKRNNSCINTISQNCLFCGTPNYVKERK